MIKSWNKRLPNDTPDDDDVIHAMQDEINELRAEVLKLNGELSLLGSACDNIRKAAGLEKLDLWAEINKSNGLIREARKIIKASAGARSAHSDWLNRTKDQL